MDPYDEHREIRIRKPLEKRLSYRPGTYLGSPGSRRGKQREEAHAALILVETILQGTQ
jgi:hypothetical protein